MSEHVIEGKNIMLFVVVVVAVMFWPQSEAAV